MGTIRVSLDELKPEPIRVKLSELGPAASSSQPWLDRPLIPLESLKLDPKKQTGALSQFAAGLQRGGVSTFEDFTTPKSVGTLGAVAAASAIPVVGEVVAPAAGLYFGYEMLKGAFEEAPEAYKAWQRGDYGSAGELLARAGLGAAFAAAGVRHGAGKPLRARLFDPYEAGGVKPTMRIGPQSPATEAALPPVPSVETPPTEPARPLPVVPLPGSSEYGRQTWQEAQAARRRVTHVPLEKIIAATTGEEALPAPPKVEPLPAAPLTGEIFSGTVPPEVSNAPRVDEAKPVGRGGAPAGAPVLPSRPPGNPVWTGQATEVRVPGESTRYEATYELRELSDIESSHVGQTFQPNPRYQHRNDRNYNDPANQERVAINSTQEKFDPSLLLTDNPTATNGPPVIDQNGNTLGGNSRVMILQRVYGEAPAAADSYRSALRSKLQQFGIDPAQEAAMKQPVLVRRLAAPDVDYQRAITDLNKKETADLTPAEQALSQARMMTPEALDYLQGVIEGSGLDVSLSDILSGSRGGDILNKLVDSGVFTTQEKGALVDAKTGALTQLAKNRISQAMLGGLFRDSDQFQRTPPELRNKLERIVAPVSRLRGTGEWDLKPVVEEAIDFMEELRARGGKGIDVSKKNGSEEVKKAIAGGFIAPEEGKGLVIASGKGKGQLTEKGKLLIEDRMRARQEQELILGQGGLFEGPRYSPDAVAFARFLQRKPTDIAAGVRDFAGAAEPSLNPTGTLFEPIPRDEAFARAFGGEPLSRGGEPPAGQLPAPPRILSGLPIAEEGRASGQKGAVGFDLTPPGKTPSPPDRQSEWFNFGRMRFSSPEEEVHFRASLDEAVDKYRLDPKQVEPHAAVLEAARSIDPELVKEVQREADAGINNRAARFAMRQRIGALNRELVGAYREIDAAKTAAVPEADRLALEQKASAMEQDLQQYLGVWAGIRSMDGRNLAMHRMMADSTWDLTTWLTKARKAAGLPPDANLPEPVAVGIRKAVAQGEEAQNVVEAAVPPDVRTEIAAAKTTLEQAETKAKQAQVTAEEAAKVQEQTTKAQETRKQAQAVLSEANRKLYGARQSYQRVLDKREKLLAENPRVQEATKQLVEAKRTLAKEVAKLQQTGWWEMLSSLWRAGLLTGPKTHARNIIGNFAFQASEELSKIPASMMDIVLSVATDQRTTVGPSLRAITRSSAEASTKGVREAAEILQHGATADDLAKVERVAEMNFQGLGKYSNIINKYVNTVFRTMSAEDKVAKVYGVRRSLEAQAKVMALNEARQGALPQREVLKRAAWLTEHPTEPMAAQAVADSEFSTFNNQNVLASALGRFQSALPAPGRFVMNLAFPFVRTPTNIAMRLYDYTPMGPAYKIPKALIQAKRASGKFLTPGAQKVVSEAFGRGAVGTGLIFLGYKLAEQAMATGTGQIPSGQRNVQEAVGRPTGGVRIGNDWYQFLGFAPIGNLITVGASLYRERSGKLSDEARRPARIAAIGTRSVLDQPLMTGMQSIIDALENPEARASRLAEGYAGSVVPTAVADAATLIDPRRRQVEGPMDALTNRIPLLKSTLPERTDVLGRPLEANRSSAYNPFLPRGARETSDPLAAELVRNEIRIGDPNKRPGEPEAEFRARRDFAGKLIESELRQTIASTDYYAATKDERKELLDSAVRRARVQVTAYTTKDEDYQREAPPQRVQRLRQYIGILEGDLVGLRQSREIPPVPTVQ